jgi:deazaflavin-dependent oxidoreductase (nitroreductase family)
VLTTGMSDTEYEPSTAKWVRDQVEQYESSGGTESTTLRDSGLPVVIITNLGAKSGKIRKTPVMRVEHDGSYAAVASQGGAPTHPYWYYNLIAHPRVTLQDGPVKREMIARELTGAERDEWWARGVAAYPPYAEYQKKTTRIIPVFVLEPAELRLAEAEVVNWPCGRGRRALSGHAARTARIPGYPRPERPPGRAARHRARRRTARSGQPRPTGQPSSR